MTLTEHTINTLRKQGASRTFRLSDKQLIIEFYDRQAAVIASMEDLRS